MKKHNYKKLLIWQEARVLVKEIYLISKSFPEDERFGLTSQIRRAIVSVSLNIVEGSGRVSDKDFANFLNMAYTSLLEVEGILILIVDLEYYKEFELDSLNNKIEELLKMIYTFRENLLK
ncbi:MAG: four helix bundle protein [Bacteroidetes bacterium]|nr:four helix bundle protein [Bacteroidota bacterium]MCB9227435.1 four helix bundle protein [Chitinophagales bacterium]